MVVGDSSKVKEERPPPYALHFTSRFGEKVRKHAMIESVTRLIVDEECVRPFLAGARHDLILLSRRRVHPTSG
jgi:hypothetical protein